MNGWTEGWVTAFNLARQASEMDSVTIPAMQVQSLNVRPCQRHSPVLLPTSLWIQASLWSTWTEYCDCWQALTRDIVRLYLYGCKGWHSHLGNNTCRSWTEVCCLAGFHACLCDWFGDV